jgi:hypothetical protein
MLGFPTSVLVGGGVVLAIWLATLALAVIAFRSHGSRAVVLAAVALGVSLLFTTVLSARIGKKETSTGVLPNGEKRIRTSGWQLDSKWFFAVSGLISLSALVVALRNRARTTEANVSTP